MKGLPRRVVWSLAGLLAVVVLSGLGWLVVTRDIPIRIGMTMEEVEIEIIVTELTTDGNVGGRYNGEMVPYGQSVEVFSWDDFVGCSTVIEWTYDPQGRVDSVRRFLEIFLRLPWVKRKYWEFPLLSK